MTLYGTPAIHCMHVSRDDYEAMLSMTDAQRSAWIKARIPDGHEYADPMPVRVGGLMEGTFFVHSDPPHGWVFIDPKAVE